MESACRCISLCVALLLYSIISCAQSSTTYPANPVRILLPNNPGGATDFVARLMQGGLASELGQSVIIDNRPGAGGKIAVELAARSPADGYTLLFGNIAAIAVNPAIFRSHPVQPARDLVCLNVIAESTAALVVHSSVPARTLEQLIRLAKARPGELNYGAASPASPARLGMEIFTKQAGIDLLGVTYKGTGDVATALLSGEVAIASASLATVLPYIQSGKLRALAIKSLHRSNLLPRVPSFAELGYPDMTMASWQALYVRAGTPRPIIETLHSAIARVMSDPALTERTKPAAMHMLKSISLEECADFTRSQIAAWARIVREVGVAGTM